MPEYSLEELSLKLKFQYLGHLMQNADSLEKTLMLWKIEGKRRGRQKMRWLDSTTNSVDVNLSELLETVEDRGTGMLQTMKLQWVRHNLSTGKWQQGKSYFSNKVWIGIDLFPSWAQSEESVTGAQKESAAEEKFSSLEEMAFSWGIHPGRGKLGWRNPGNKYPALSLFSFISCQGCLFVTSIRTNQE